MAWRSLKAGVLITLMIWAYSFSMATEKSQGASQVWTQFWGYYHLSDSSHVFLNTDFRFAQNSGENIFAGHYRSHVECGYNHYVSGHWNLGGSVKFVDESSDGGQGYFKAFFDHIGYVGKIEFRKQLSAEYLFRPEVIPNRVINDQSRFAAQFILRRNFKYGESTLISAEAGLRTFVRNDLEAEVFVPFKDRFIDESRWWILGRVQWNKTFAIEAYFLRWTQYAYNSIQEENFNLYSHVLGFGARWMINSKGMEVRWK